MERISTNLAWAAQKYTKVLHRAALRHASYHALVIQEVHDEQEVHQRGQGIEKDGS